MRLEEEKEIVSLMIKLYCQKKHHTKGQLCHECQELLAYVDMRLKKCPFGDKKSFCSNCKIHCYEKNKREKIKEVMRFSGPRMLFYHPLWALKHVKESVKEKKNGKK